MGLNSINTNAGALVALQNLNQTNRDLAVAQGRINTGQKVASAKDNGAVFAIASQQRADASALETVRASMGRGQSIVDVALAAGDSVIDALKEMKLAAIGIESSAAGSAALTAYQADFTRLQAEITASLNGANFDGSNLWTDATAVTVRTGLTATSTVSLGGTAFTGATGIAETTAGVDAAISAVTAALAGFGTQSKSLERTSVFVDKLQSALEVGVSNLVDADLAKESARLTALQTKQQLGVQALSIANQSSSALLGLFR